MTKRMQAARDEAEQLLIWDSQAAAAPPWAEHAPLLAGEGIRLVGAGWAWGPTATAQEPNIVGVGLREKVTDGHPTGIPSIAVYVVQKEPIFAVSGPAVPKEIDGVPTDVVETGGFMPFSPRLRLRPTVSGASIGHSAGTLGSLGFFAQRGSSRQLYLVSCNHVLARTNRAHKNDAVLQPAPYDGADPDRDQVGRLDDWEELYFDAPNRIDAALAEIADAKEIYSPGVYNVGDLDPRPLDPAEHLPVLKSGRTSQVTHGEVTDPINTLVIPYGSRKAIMREQVIVEATTKGQRFSKPGDSGALVLEEGTLRPVGMICGGSRRFRYTIANRITNVLDDLGVSFWR